jgi:hypothetical protein
MADLSILNHFWMTLIILLPIVLISRAVVAGTKYSPILIIVIFGLSLGLIFDITNISTPGLTNFPMLGFTSGVTVTALIVTFFVGGQTLRNTFFKPKLPKEDDVIFNTNEVILGTNGTQLILIVRAYFILVGIESLKRIILNDNSGSIASFYPLIAFFGVAGAFILIDSKAKIVSKQAYIGRGIVEVLGILLILVVSYYLSVFVKDVVALPQIFFAMIISSSLGMYFSNWRGGPTFKSLLFGGIPVVLAAVFLVGGSRLLEAFTLDGMLQVMAFGFFGQLFWMFLGMALLVFLGKQTSVDIVAPGMAGSLSHSGLTGACTAGDLGEEAKKLAPIMINVPFLGHLFVFTILAWSASRGTLLLIPSIIVVLIGAVLTYVSLNVLKKSNKVKSNEVKGLMLFSLGWQLVAVFGGFIMLTLAGVNLNYAAMANSSAISHFGLFASIQGGMFGVEASGLISFIFAMPFLIHPVVFGMFGNAMEHEGHMNKKAVFVLAVLGIIGVLFTLIVL